MPRFKNIHTNEEREIVGSECTDGYNHVHTFILDDGTRWESKLFMQHWQAIIEEGDTPIMEQETL